MYYEVSGPQAFSLCIVFEENGFFIIFILLYADYVILYKKGTSAVRILLSIKCIT